MRTARMRTAGALWSVLRGHRRRGGTPLREQVSALPRLAVATLLGRYPGLTRARLALMALAALYVVSPVDIVPESLFAVFGLADDAVVLAWLAAAALAESDTFLRWEAGQGAPAPSRRAGGERVVPGEVV